MPKKEIGIFKTAYLQVAGVLLLLLMAVFLLWYHNANSNQAMNAMVAQVRFWGEYRIGNGQWQEIVEGQHIPASKGDVTLRGNFIPLGNFTEAVIGSLVC